VTEHENNAKVYYLPHRPVIREDHSTTKVRVVFDASSHAKDQFSLNDCLHTGHNLLPNLFNLLVHFRINKFAVIADLEKAFLQIQIKKEDRDFTRFFWIDNTEDKEVDIYRMTRVLFGVCSSPFLLAATIKYHLKRWSLVQDLKDKFWTRWSKEYLAQLQPRQKWRTPQPNLQEGQLVLLKDGNKPLQWNLGRIERVIPGEDGLIRVADVKTASTIYRRAINKIIPLPFQNVGQPSNGGRDGQN
ncbi:unnamed protein product, partial [Larinioides sclopetarius]